MGPARRDKAWQAKEGTGFDQTRFEIDWERKRAVCPEGKETSDWRPGVRRKRNIVWIRFSRKDCGPCPSRELCVRRRAAEPNNRSPRRTLVVSASEEHHEALKAARRRESDASYEGEYARREGIEGTISRAVRRCGMRRSRYVGSRKTRLQHLMTATAMNFLRAGEWFAGSPRAATRVSPFAKLVGRQTAA